MNHHGNCGRPRSCCWSAAAEMLRVKGMSQKGLGVWSSRRGVPLSLFPLRCCCWQILPEKDDPSPLLTRCPAGICPARRWVKRGQWCFLPAPLSSQISGAAPTTAVPGRAGHHPACVRGTGETLLPRGPHPGARHTEGLLFPGGAPWGQQAASSPRPASQHKALSVRGL